MLSPFMEGKEIAEEGVRDWINNIPLNDFYVIYGELVFKEELEFNPALLEKEIEVIKLVSSKNKKPSDVGTLDW